MTGKVNTREKCRICGLKFTMQDGELKCCNTRPDTYFIYLYHKGDHRISRDRDGRILDSYRRADRLLETIRGEIDRGTFDPKIFIPKQAEEYRIKNLWARYRSRKNDLSNWHKLKIDEYARRFYLPILGELHAADIKRFEIEKLYDSLPAHLALKTKKNIMDGFRAFVRWLQEVEVVTKIITFPTISPEEVAIKWISKQQQLAAVEKIKPSDQPIFRFLIAHPVRPGEVCALQRKHFDLEKMTITVCQAVGFHELKSRKSKKAYVLPISASFDVAPLRLMLPEAFIFTNSKGRRYHPSHISRLWREVCPTINLYNATRHSIASQAVNNGIPLERIGGALGHVNTKMTRRYASMNVELLRDVIDGTAQVLPIGQKKADNSG